MKLGRATWRSLTVVAAVLAVWLLLPEIAGYGWRAVRGGTIEHLAWRVPVPAGWFATERGDALTISRLARFPWRSSEIATLVPGRRQAVPFRIWLEVWEMMREEKTAQMAAAGYRAAGERLVEVGGAEGRCAEYRGAEDESRRAAFCEVHEHNLVATFYGRAAGEAHFYALLAALEPPAAPAPAQR